MEEVLVALGWRVHLWRRAWLVFILFAWTSGFLVASYAISFSFKTSPLIFHSLAWVAWLAWLGWLFPKNHAADIQYNAENAYRRAFYRDILNGITCSFSQLLRPFFFGLSASPIFSQSPWHIGFGMVILLIGGLLVMLGVKALGIKGAMFLYEYKPGPPVVSQAGVYKYIRHPMFFGGVIMSLGFGLIVANEQSRLMSVINVVVLPFYYYIEDARCNKIFGIQYQKYKRLVAGFIPIFPASMKSRLWGDRMRPALKKRRQR